MNASGTTAWTISKFDWSVLWIVECTATVIPHPYCQRYRHVRGIVPQLVLAGRSPFAGVANVMDLEVLNPLNWDWLTIVKGAFGAGIGTVGVQVVWPYVQERRAKTDRAAYLALRVAVTLEAYASDCIDLIFDNANLQEPYDAPYPAWNSKLPEPPSYPDDDLDGWRSMTRSLVTRCFNFPNKVRGSQGMLRSTVENGHEGELSYMIDEHAAQRGIEAWEIATSLREEYHLSPSEMIFDYVDALRSTLKGALAAKAAHEESQAAMTKVMFPDKAAAPTSTD